IPVTNNRGVLSFGPEDALVRPRDGTDALVHELLDALSLVGLGRVEVALRVRRNAVHREELARLAAAIAEARQDLQRLAIHHVDPLVLAVPQKEVLLLGVG